MASSEVRSSTRRSDSSESDSDRRRSKREDTVTPGVLRCVSDDAGSAPQTQVLVTDVSIHGVGFRSPERLDRTQTYTIEIGTGPLHLAATLKIARYRIRPDGIFDVGGEFC